MSRNNPCYSQLHLLVNNKFTTNFKRFRKLNPALCLEVQRNRLSVSSSHKSPDPCHTHTVILMIFVNFIENLWGPKTELYHMVHRESCRKILIWKFSSSLFLSLMSLMFYSSLLLSCHPQPHWLHFITLNFSTWDLKFYTSSLWRANFIIIVICTFFLGLIYHPKRLLKHFFWTNIAIRFQVNAISPILLH